MRLFHYSLGLGSLLCLFSSYPLLENITSLTKPAFTCAQNSSTTVQNITSTAQIVTLPSSTASTSTPLASGIVLRIQPLGDSITYGYRSSDGNGYRLPLENTLTSAGNIVSYVGSVRSGNMTDNYNEGHPGAVISQIATYAPLSSPQNPNVVLLMAGSNDCNNPTDVDTAPERLQSLINEVVQAVPDAVVLVALLPPITTSPTALVNVATYNAAVPGILNSLVQQGKHVLGVNMSSFLTNDDLIDSLHPTDGGYVKMAGAWYEGLKAADGLGFIKHAPEPQQGYVNATTTVTGLDAMKTGGMENGAAGGRVVNMFSIMGLGSVAMGMSWWA